MSTVECINRFCTGRRVQLPALQRLVRRQQQLRQAAPAAGRAAHPPGRLQQLRVRPVRRGAPAGKENGFLPLLQLFASSRHWCLAAWPAACSWRPPSCLLQQFGRYLPVPEPGLLWVVGNPCAYLNTKCVKIACRSTLRLQYAPAWRRTLVNPLLQEEEAGIPAVIEVIPSSCSASCCA